MFDYGASRARQARAGRLLGGSVLRTSLWLFVLISLALGATLLWTGAAIGWLLVGLAAIFIMAALWGKALTDLQPGRNTDVSSLLETVLLGRLPRSVTPTKLAKIVETQPGGLFILARFMLGRDFLTHVVTDDLQIDAIWQRADALRQTVGEPQITSSMVAVALILESPQAPTYLAHAGLDADDLVAGIRWAMHMDQLFAQYRERRRVAGGIGRDWAFGYTPLLERLGHNVSDQISGGNLIARETLASNALLPQMIDTLSKSGRRNVALVGQLGSGKTKLVQMLAARLLNPDRSVPQALQYNQVITLDPSVLISRAPGRGQLEELVLHLCAEALNAKNVVLFLDDAHLFFEDGPGAVDLTNVLGQFLDGGALKIVLAVDEQRWTQITQRNASLTQYLNRLMVAPADEAHTRQIMENQAPLLEHQYGVLLTYQALSAAYELSSRYVAEQVMPGRALSLLEAAAHQGENGLVTRGSVERALEQTRGVKVATANTAQERDTLINLEELIHARMINQSHAVRAVSDALRRARAGVRNTSRPIGTFMFLGPTGVGKTELAKAIAAVYFGDESNMVRLDMNEFVSGSDVKRLIADPAADSHSLTAQVARQPFSVVLLDEIEKAHPEVLTTLLQLLDEGVLRDVNNREVSFRDCIVIATSNAGAEKIIERIASGEAFETFEQEFVNQLISSGQFKPEFLNRFDEIALFRPLNQDELKQVIGLILQGVNKTLSTQKLTVQVDDDAKTRLVEAGYDARLGARPMRRIVQQTVENIVADKVLRQEAIPGTTIPITLADIDGMLARRS